MCAVCTTITQDIQLLMYIHMNYTFFFGRLFRVIKRKTTYNGLRCDAKHVEKFTFHPRLFGFFGKESQEKRKSFCFS